MEKVGGGDCWNLGGNLYKINKVITTMVIRPLDDPT